MTATFKLTRHLLPRRRFHLAWWDATRCFGLVAAVIFLAFAAWVVLHEGPASWPGSDLPVVALARTALSEVYV